MNEQVSVMQIFNDVIVKQFGSMQEPHHIIVAKMRYFPPIPVAKICGDINDAHIITKQMIDKYGTNNVRIMCADTTAATKHVNITKNMPLKIPIYIIVPSVNGSINIIQNKRDYDGYIFSNCTIQHVFANHVFRNCTFENCRHILPWSSSKQTYDCTFIGTQRLATRIVDTAYDIDILPPYNI